MPTAVMRIMAKLKIRRWEEGFDRRQHRPHRVPEDPNLVGLREALEVYHGCGWSMTAEWRMGASSGTAIEVEVQSSARQSRRRTIEHGNDLLNLMVLQHCTLKALVLRTA